MQVVKLKDNDNSIIIECFKQYQNVVVGFYSLNYLHSKGITINPFTMKCTDKKNYFQYLDLVLENKLQDVVVEPETFTDQDIVNIESDVVVEPQAQEKFKGENKGIYIVNKTIKKYNLNQGDEKTFIELEAILGDKLQQYLKNGNILETTKIID